MPGRSRSCVPPPSLKFLPDPVVKEVAFAGRSNVGKVVAAECAHQSYRPRAHIEYAGAHAGTGISSMWVSRCNSALVDMPGYGYAKAPKDVVKQWRFLVNDYLRGRAVLKRTLLPIDARHGIMMSTTTS